MSAPSSLSLGQAGTTVLSRSRFPSVCKMPWPGRHRIGCELGGVVGDDTPRLSDHRKTNPGDRVCCITLNNFVW